jgi:uncharacterized protein
MRIARIPMLVLPLLLAMPALTRADPFDSALRASDEGRHGEAAAAFHALAMAGDGAAAYNLAALFATGRGIPQNETEALYWAWRARLAGVAQASALLGRLWPPPEAARRKAIADRLEAALLPLAEAGDGAAMLQLAAVLGVVRGAPDHRAAHAWQSIAATLNVPGAFAARDATLAGFPPAERAAVQDGALAAFRSWCERHEGNRPAACDVVIPAMPSG